MRYTILWSLLALILIAMMPGESQVSDKQPLINLMIETQMPFSATDEQIRSNLDSIYSQINSRGLVGTIFITQDVIRKNLDLTLTNIGLRSKVELAMSGNNSNETISSMPYADQSTSLKLSKSLVEACKICGKNNITVNGFKPQSFDQNQDTYKVLDSLGIQYDAGFQAGLLYTTGHENDVWPYLVQGHKFYAVPVSTYTISGEKLVLQDSYFKNRGFEAAQWYDAMVGKFDEIQGKDEPLVIGITTSISGSGEYLDALNMFMDYALSNKASFVTTMQLVDLAKTGERDVSALLPENSSGVCATCGQEGENYSISISSNIIPAQTANNTTQVAAPE